MTERGMLPNVFVAGVPKAGTTSLAADLARHPDVDVSRPKEPCLFALDDPTMIPQPFFETAEAMLSSLELSDGYSSLLSKRSEAAFRGSEKMCRVDCTPGYLCSDVARRRIHQWAPDSRFIIVLREPTERLISSYWHQMRHGRVRDNFTEWLMYEGLHAFNSGMYFEHLEKWFQVFSRDQFLILTNREYQDRREETLKAIFRHIEVDAAAYDYGEKAESKNVTPYPRVVRIRLFLNLIGRKFSRARRTTSLFDEPVVPLTFRRQRDRVIFALASRLGKLVEGPVAHPVWSKDDLATIGYVRRLYALRNADLNSLVGREIDRNW